MVKKVLNINALVTGIAIFVMLGGVILPAVLADTSKIYVDGFDRGVSWKPYIPLKRTTFIQLDQESYLDDYAYLAAIPTSVFYDKNEERIFSNPLLFYEDEYKIDEEKERSLNARQGIDYFMEDWMSYCGGRLDQMTLINVPKNKIDTNWRAKNYTTIECTNPSDLASQIALHDWSYADNAVVAVIDEKIEKQENKTDGSLKGTVPKADGVRTEHFEVPKTNEVYPIYNQFTVPEGYKFLKVRSWYPCFYLDMGIPGFEGIVNMSIPTGDRDLQIHCWNDEEDDWMMAGLTNAWNAQGGMDLDKTSCYVYHSGKWSVSITDVPTKSMDSGSFSPDGNTIDTSLEPQKHRNFLVFNFGRYGRILDILKNMKQVTYQVDVEMYPGTTIEIPELPPYGCRNAFFELTWDDPNVDLGFSVIGPSGEEVLSTREPGVSSACNSPENGEGADIPLPPGTETDLRIERLGELLPGEHYSISVFSMNEMSSSTDFTVEYSWEQNITRSEGDGLASATEGAILASIINAPLLYTSSSEVSSVSIDTLNKLGVENIFLVDLGGHLSSKGKNQLKEAASISDHFTKYENIYNHIREITGRNDVIFSTVDPFTYWYVAELETAGELPGALSVGPAAYIAAHHGSPVLLIDNHPELSSALPWHNELWRRHPDGHSKLPTVSEMYLTGKRVYDFLKALDYDKEGEETIITVAGQYDIGLTWDRVFVGKGKPGRFIGSPTDLSVWISKNVFYPQLVFENPAIDQNGVQMINGSSSRRGTLGIFPPYRGKLGLKITKESQEETFKYPVLDTLICYDHKFNSRASKYWGFTYACADGDIPGETPSNNLIDDGVMLAVNGQEGAFLADLSGSEVQPFYLRKGGYDPVYSTNFEANMNNLNKGVLLWMINTHGAPTNGGMLMFWDVEGNNPVGYPPIPLAGYNKETNPWRGYEWLMGSTEEPDTMTSEIHGILPALTGNPTRTGLLTTALDWALAKRPIRDMIGRVAGLPLIKWFTPTWLQDTEDYYDGVIITIFVGRFGTAWYNGTMIDDELGNLHSTGISSVACLPAGKYLHLTMMRHGSVFQIMDPWATSWYSDVWQNMVPRGIALGQTIGEIYTEGISKVGILYVADEDDAPQWWWDLAENVCLYGDPDLRIWVPSTEYSSKNHWEPEDVAPISYNVQDGFYADGHMPYGVEEYPNQKEPTSLVGQIAWIAVIVAILSVIIIGAIILIKKRR
jgi:hypothetical protein